MYLYIHTQSIYISIVRFFIIIFMFLLSLIIVLSILSFEMYSIEYILLARSKTKQSEKTTIS